MNQTIPAAAVRSYQRLRHAVRRRAAQRWTSFPGEIVGDELAERITALAADPDVTTLLEIGSGAGDGSTRAFVEGIRRRERQDVKLFCVEVSPERADELAARFPDDFVHVYQAASATPAEYASEEDVRAFCALASPRPAVPADQLLLARDYELAFLEERSVQPEVIETIKRDHGIETFDVVLLDGSEFLGLADLRRVHGARWLLLDDTNTLKNHQAAMLLLDDPDYELVASNPSLRNGYAAFRHTGSRTVS